MGAVVTGAAWRFSPVFRRVATVQLRTYLVLSFAVAGGAYTADNALLKFERQMKLQQIMENNQKLEEAADRGEYIG